MKYFDQESEPTPYFIIIINKTFFIWSINYEIIWNSGGKTKGGTAPGGMQIPPDIYGNLFHFEKNLFLFKM